MGTGLTNRLIAITLRFGSQIVYPVVQCTLWYSVVHVYPPPPTPPSVRCTHIVLLRGRAKPRYAPRRGAPAPRWGGTRRGEPIERVLALLPRIYVYVRA
jgi:hypothetical protein